MPEGDTVHKIANFLRPRLEGVELSELGSRPRDPMPVWVEPPHRVERIEVRGKHLFITFERDSVVRCHLGMHGSWHGYAPGAHWDKPRRQASLWLTTRDSEWVCFNAAEVEWLRRQGFRHRDWLARLGPDLIGSTWAAPELCERARELLPSTTPLVDVLLDQRVASGVGNVYKSELLFLERHAVDTTLEETTDTALGSLYERAQSLLRKNLGGGPRRTRWENESPSNLWVYGRRGQSCLVCGCPVEQGRRGFHQRTTYWCPSCQKS